MKERPGWHDSLIIFCHELRSEQVGMVMGGPKRPGAKVEDRTRSCPVGSTKYSHNPKYDVQVNFVREKEIWIADGINGTNTRSPW